MTATAAASLPEEKRPAHWDKRVSAAYLRILGATQADAAKAVARSVRAIRLWEAHDSWPAAQAEARARWLVDLSDASRNALVKAIRAGDAASARWVLERTEPALSPPATKHEHTGTDGAPIAHEMTVRFVKASPP